jgi:hypothetical protein
MWWECAKVYIGERDGGGTVGLVVSKEEDEEEEWGNGKMEDGG